MPDRTTVNVIAVALLVLVSMGAAGASQTVNPDSAVDQAQIAGMGGADEAYVAGDGTVVLVFEEQTDDTTLSGEFDLDAETGILYTQLVQEMEEGSDITGDATFELTQDLIAASGSFQGSTEPTDEDFSATLDLEQTRTTNEFTATMESTTTNGFPSGNQQSVDFELSQEITDSTLSTDGSVQIDGAADPAGLNDASIAVSIEQVDDDLLVGADVTTQVPGEMAGDFADEATAEATIEAMLDELAIELGGIQSDFQLESHQFSGDAVSGGTLDITVSTTLQDVMGGIGEAVLASLEADPMIDLSNAEAQSIADRFAELQLTDAEFSVQTDASGTADLSWNLEAENYDQVLLGVVEIAEALPEVDDQLASDFDQVRDLVEAQSAAGLVQTFELSGSMTDDGAGTETFAVEASGNSENWGAYVEELESRGIDAFVGDSHVTFEAESSGEDVSIDFDFEVSEEGLLQSAAEYVGSAQTGVPSFGGTGVPMGAPSMANAPSLAQFVAQEDPFGDNPWEGDDFDEGSWEDAFGGDTGDGSWDGGDFDGGSWDGGDGPDGMPGDGFDTGFPNPADQVEQVVGAFDRGKADVTMDGSSVEIEAGAGFTDASVIDSLGATLGGQLESVSVRAEDGVGTTYVTFAGLVDSSASEQDVRSTAFVDANTAVYMPGDWDREFPSMDTDSAEQFLSTVGEATGDGDDGLLGMPGFGVGVALIAVLSSLAVLGRRGGR